jgi:hypothetical protein
LRKIFNSALGGEGAPGGRVILQLSLRGRGASVVKISACPDPPDRRYRMSGLRNFSTKMCQIAFCAIFGRL